MLIISIIIFAPHISSTIIIYSPHKYPYFPMPTHHPLYKNNKCLIHIYDHLMLIIMELSVLDKREIKILNICIEIVTIFINKFKNYINCKANIRNYATIDAICYIF